LLDTSSSVGILGGGGDIGSSAAAAATSRLNYNHNQSNNSSSVQLMSTPKTYSNDAKNEFFPNQSENRRSHHHGLSNYRATPTPTNATAASNQSTIS